MPIPQIPYDKLLGVLKEEAESAGFRMDRNAWFTLSDIVELHEIKSNCSCGCGCCQFCSYCKEAYPCKTITIIIKELM